MKLKKYEGNPILSPNPENYWESLVVCNPGRDMCIACSGSSWILPMYSTNFQFSETFPPGSRSIV